jgi:hypothetical protein
MRVSGALGFGFSKLFPAGNKKEKEKNKGKPVGIPRYNVNPSEFGYAL